MISPVALKSPGGFFCLGMQKKAPVEVSFVWYSGTECLSISLWNT